MAQPFRSGNLPSPMPVASGNPDDIAASLAKTIAAADEQSTAALITAIQVSGFSVRGEDGAIKYKPIGAGQGLAFDAFSVASMAKLYNDGWAISLTDLSVVLGKIIPTLEKQNTSGIFVDSIAKASQGDQPLRFWARVIVELGRQSTPDYDLLDPKMDPAKVQLNAIQVSFLLQRFIGEMLTIIKHAAPAAHAGYRRRGWNWGARFQPAVFHQLDKADLILADDQDSNINSPCGENADTILDGITALKSTGWLNLFGNGESEEEGVSMAPANAVFIVLRFIYIYAAMNAKVTMEKVPLERTYEGPWTQDMRYNGQQDVLTAHVWFEVHNWPCLVWAFMRAGLSRNDLDVGNLPRNGAAKGVGVAWEGLEGFGGINSPDAQHAAMVAFDNVENSGFQGATWNKETDDNGDTTMKVTGLAQLYDLTYMKRLPVMKKMSVRVDIAYKHNGSAEKMLDELIDVFGPAIATSKGNVLEGLTGAIAETMFRMHWYSSGVFEFPVKDWLACTKGWIGEITYHRQESSTHTDNPRPGTQTTHALQLTEDRKYQINGSDGRYQASELHAVWTGQYLKRTTQIDSTQGPSYWCKQNHTLSQETTTITGANTSTADFGLSIIGNRYNLGLVPNPEELTRLVLKGGTVTHRESHSSEANGAEPESDCQDSSSDDTSVVSPLPWFVAFPLITGVLDPKSPEEITGSQEFRDPQDPSGKVVITWDLMHCGN